MNSSLTRFLYCPQIPLGQARTRGYGKTCRVMIIEADKSTFKTLNSPHRVIKNFGCYRMDYGLKRGNAAKILAEAREYLKMVQLPEERTTRDEF